MYSNLIIIQPRHQDDVTDMMMMMMMMMMTQVYENTVIAVFLFLIVVPISCIQTPLTQSMFFYVLGLSPCIPEVILE